MYVILIALFFSPGFAQGIDEAIESLESGKSGQLVRFMGPTIQFSINEHSETLPKAAAEAKLQHFLTVANPVKVTLQHKGTSKNNVSNYRVAKLLTHTENYRLFVYLETSTQGVQIKEIRLDKE